MEWCFIHWNAAFDAAEEADVIQCWAHHIGRSWNATNEDFSLDVEKWEAAFPKPRASVWEMDGNEAELHVFCLIHHRINANHYLQKREKPRELMKTPIIHLGVPCLLWAGTEEDSDEDRRSPLLSFDTFSQMTPQIFWKVSEKRKISTVENTNVINESSALTLLAPALICSQIFLQTFTCWYWSFPSVLCTQHCLTCRFSEFGAFWKTDVFLRLKDILTGFSLI